MYSPVTPGLRVFYLFMLLLAGLFIGGLLLTVLPLFPGLDSSGRATIYVGTVLQSIMAFLLPAYLVVRMSGSSPSGYMRLNHDVRMGQKMAFGIVAFILFYACSAFLNQWNKGIVLPEVLRHVEEWMRSLEDAAMEATHLLLSGGGTLHLALNLLILAGVAAFSEEIFFRGALQQFLQEKYRNGHAAVWITALIFSAIHLQFYGFFPRLALGALLGYLFLYTRNLWIPILVHFINNASVVVLSHFWGDSEWMRSMEGAEATASFAVIAVLSATLTILLFQNYRKKSAYFPERAETPRS